MQQKTIRKKKTSKAALLDWTRGGEPRITPEQAGRLAAQLRGADLHSDHGIGVLFLLVRALAFTEGADDRTELQETIEKEFLSHSMAVGRAVDQLIQTTFDAETSSEE